MWTECTALQRWEGRCQRRIKLLLTSIQVFMTVFTQRVVLFHCEHETCWPAVWVSRGSVRSWEVAWKCYLIKWNKPQTSCLSSSSCLEPVVHRLVVKYLGGTHQARFQDILLSLCFPFSPRGFHQTVMTGKRIFSPTFVLAALTYFRTKQRGFHVTVIQV